MSAENALTEVEMSARISALKAFSRREATSDDLDAVILEFLHTKSDRGRTLLGAAMLQSALEGAIRPFLVGDLSKGYEETLFDGDGPLAGFSRVIRVAYAFGIIDKNMERELQYVREIRNAFAHSRISFDFETPQVKAVCELFAKHYTDAPELKLSIDHPRMKFIGCVTAIFKVLAEAARKDKPTYPLSF